MVVKRTKSSFPYWLDFSEIKQPKTLGIKAMRPRRRWQPPPSGPLTNAIYVNFVTNRPFSRWPYVSYLPDKKFRLGYFLKKSRQDSKEYWTRKDVHAIIYSAFQAMTAYSEKKKPQLRGTEKVIVDKTRRELLTMNAWLVRQRIFGPPNCLPLPDQGRLPLHQVEILVVVVMPLLHEILQDLSTRSSLDLLQLRYLCEIGSVFGSLSDFRTSYYQSFGRSPSLRVWLPGPMRGPNFEDFADGSSPVPSLPWFGSFMPYYEKSLLAGLPAIIVPEEEKSEKSEKPVDRGRVPNPIPPIPPIPPTSTPAETSNHVSADAQPVVTFDCFPSSAFMVSQSDNYATTNGLPEPLYTSPDAVSILPTAVTVADIQGSTTVLDNAMLGNAVLENSVLYNTVLGQERSTFLQSYPCPSPSPLSANGVEIPELCMDMDTPQTQWSDTTLSADFETAVEQIFQDMLANSYPDDPYNQEDLAYEAGPPAQDAMMMQQPMDFANGLVMPQPNFLQPAAQFEGLMLPPQTQLQLQPQPLDTPMMMLPVDMTFEEYGYLDVLTFDQMYPLQPQQGWDEQGQIIQ